MKEIFRRKLILSAAFALSFAALAAGAAALSSCTPGDSGVGQLYDEMTEMLDLDVQGNLSAELNVYTDINLDGSLPDAVNGEYHADDSLYDMSVYLTEGEGGRMFTVTAGAAGQRSAAYALNGRLYVCPRGYEIGGVYGYDDLPVDDIFGIVGLPEGGLGAIAGGGLEENIVDIKKEVKGSAASYLCTLDASLFGDAFGSAAEEQGIEISQKEAALLVASRGEGTYKIRLVLSFAGNMSMYGQVGFGIVSDVDIRSGEDAAKSYSQRILAADKLLSSDLERQKRVDAGWYMPSHEDAARFDDADGAVKYYDLTKSDEYGYDVDISWRIYPDSNIVAGFAANEVYVYDLCTFRELSCITFERPVCGVQLCRGELAVALGTDSYYYKDLAAELGFDDVTVAFYDIADFNLTHTVDISGAGVAVPVFFGIKDDRAVFSGGSGYFAASLKDGSYTYNDDLYRLADVEYAIDESSGTVYVTDMYFGEVAIDIETGTWRREATPDFSAQPLLTPSVEGYGYVECFLDLGGDYVCVAVRDGTSMFGLYHAEDNSITPMVRRYLGFHGACVCADGNAVFWDDESAVSIDISAFE